MNGNNGERATEENSMENSEKKEERKSPKKSVILVIAATLVAVLAVFVGMMVYNASARKLAEQLDLGNRYLEEVNYEQAEIAFTKAIEIDPMSVDAYLGIIEVYIRTGEYDLALEWAEKGYELTGDERLAEKIEMIKSGNISRWDGQQVKMTRVDNSGNIVWWHEYTYDRKNRMDSASHYGADGNLIKTLPITYNENGNRIDSFGYFEEDGSLYKEVYNYEGTMCISCIHYAEDDETIESWEINEHDEAGREIKSIRGYGSHVGSEAEIDEYSETEYGTQGNWVKHSYYDKDYNLMRYRTGEHDEEGKLQKYSAYDANGNLSWYETYEYDENGKLQKHSGYDANGNLSWYETYEYDKNGEIIKRKSYDMYGNLEYEEIYN